VAVNDPPLELLNLLLGDLDPCELAYTRGDAVNSFTGLDHVLDNVPAFDHVFFGFFRYYDLGMVSGYFIKVFNSKAIAIDSYIHNSCPPHSFTHYYHYI